MKSIVKITFLALSLTLFCAACAGGSPGINSPSPSPTPEVSLTPTPRPVNADLDAIDEAMQALIFANGEHEDLGAYQKTLDKTTVRGIDADNREIEIIALFWQCDGKDGVDSDDEQWLIRVAHSGEEIISYDLTPCEYAIITRAKAYANMLGMQNFNNVYGMLEETIVAQTLSRERLEADWADLTATLGAYQGMESIYCQYDESAYYPRVTIVLAYEQGILYCDIVFNAGSTELADLEYGAKENHDIQLYPESAVSLSGGTPVPEDLKDSQYDLTAAFDAPALKDLCKDFFLLGAALSGNRKETCAVNAPEYTAVLQKHFNSTTLTNLMKPSSILQQSGSAENAAQGIEDPVLSFAACDDTLKWCYENGIMLRGHTLVWHTQVPTWFFKEGYLDANDYVSRDTMLYRLDSYIRQYMTYVQDNYPGVVYTWDVVNEAVGTGSDFDKDSFFHVRTSHDDGKQPNYWYDVLGESYVAEAFRIARKYATEGVTLVYNDYHTAEKGKHEYIYALCESLAAEGLIDGIGMQANWGISSPTVGVLSDAIANFARLGLEIQITELSIDPPNETPAGFERQAARYAELFRMFAMMDTNGGGPANITAVTQFGLMDAFMLYENDPARQRFFDGNFQPKPAFYRVIETMNIFY